MGKSTWAVKTQHTERLNSFIFSAARKSGFGSDRSFRRERAARGGGTLSGELRALLRQTGCRALAVGSEAQDGPGQKASQSPAQTLLPAAQTPLCGGAASRPRARGAGAASPLTQREDGVACKGQGVGACRVCRSARPSALARWQRAGRQAEGPARPLGPSAQHRASSD